MPGAVNLLADSADQGRRVDLFLREKLPAFSRTALKKALESGLVLVDGKKARPALRLRGNERIEGDIPDQGRSDAAEAEDIGLDVLYEDRSLMAVNKPSNMAVHPGAGRRSGTLVNALVFHRKDRLSAAGGADRPGIVHRLDKDTSGVILIAKNDRAHAMLSDLFRERKIRKTYRAIVWGEVRGKGSVERPIGRCRRDPSKMRVDGEGKASLTRYEVVRTNGFLSELVVKPETGRTHQIRVHLSSIGHPVLGDEQYGGGREWLNRVAPVYRARAVAIMGEVSRPLLHAEKLEFEHPSSHKPMRIKAPLPDDFKRVMALL